jgi:hypothetical protein
MLAAAEGADHERAAEERRQVRLMSALSSRPGTLRQSDRHMDRQSEADLTSVTVAPGPSHQRGRLLATGPRVRAWVAWALLFRTCPLIGS